MTHYDAIIIAMIVAIPPFITAVAAVIVSLRNQNKLTQLAVTVDGRLDQLIKNTASSSEAKGHAAGIKEEQSRKHS